MLVKSLQVKLMALVLSVAVVSCSVLTFIAGKTAVSTVSKMVYQLLGALSKDVSSTIEDEIKKQFLFFDGLALLDFVKDENISFEEKCLRLRAMNDVSSEYENITYYTTDGYNLTKDGRIVHLLDREYIKQASMGHKYVSDPFLVLLQMLFYKLILFLLKIMMEK